MKTPDKSSVLQSGTVVWSSALNPGNNTWKSGMRWSQVTSYTCLQGAHSIYIPLLSHHGHFKKRLLHVSNQPTKCQVSSKSTQIILPCVTTAIKQDKAATMLGNWYLITMAPWPPHEIKTCISKSDGTGCAHECSDSHPVMSRSLPAFRDGICCKVTVCSHLPIFSCFHRTRIVIYFAEQQMSHPMSTLLYKMQYCSWRKVTFHNGSVL